MTDQPFALVSGVRYEVEYIPPAARKSKTFVGTYMGRSHIGELEFNLRPAFGTTSVRIDAVVTTTPTDAPHRGSR